MMPRRRISIRFALAGAALALFVVLAGLAGWLLPEVRPAAAHTATVSAVSITTTPASGDSYHTGEDITVRVSFNTHINGISNGQVRIGIGSNTRTVSSNTSFPNSSNVDFTYRVVAGDRDADGITVATNALSGTFRHQDGGSSSSALNRALPNTLATAQAGHKVNVIDYDADNDNLIEITTLAQLDAIRHDLDGDGAPTAGAGTTAYNTAFPNRVTAATGRMGCPGTCAGYELMADLDFDTDGDDVADGAYANWSPIDTFETTFQGNGHTISNLNISTRFAAMFSTLGGSGVITAVGLLNPTVASTRDIAFAAALVGNNSGVISASYVRGGSVTGNRGDSGVGGLVGNNRGTIRASYAAGTTVSSTGARDIVGGLAGSNADNSAVIEYSYAASAVTASGNMVNSGCLTGLNSAVGGSNTGTIRGSYYSSTACTAAGPGTAQTATQLQTPTGYTGIYSAWNLNLDGVVGNDDPWAFGTSAQLPVLKYLLTDYDTDDDNLIDITTLAQLNAIRHDLNGNGDATHADYVAAFPHRQFLATGRMGCAATCAGYELMADLDFDTDGDDDVDSNDAYPNWSPLGTYTSTFQGNGHTISNLTINSSAPNGGVGLFTELGSSSTVTALGLFNPSVSTSGHSADAGALAHDNSGTINAVYVSSGAVSATGNFGRPGGLVSTNTGTIRASYSTAAVSSGGTFTTAAGLVTSNVGGTIIASYAAGSVSATAGQGVLSYCLAPSQGTITNSYWSTGACTLTGGGGAGQSASALQTPTAYGTGSSIYLNWNVNVDGNTGNDDPWYFGTSSQYPILQFGRDAIGIQAQRNPDATTVDYDTNDNNLIDITTLARLDAVRYDLDGDGASVTGAGAVKYANAFPGVSAGMGCAAACIGYELRADLDFDTGNDGNRANDQFYNGGAGWTPIGTDRVPFSGTFRGNGHTLSNLHVNSGATIATVGLFGTLSGAVTGIGLPNASVTGAADNTAIGALTGTLGASGTVTSSWATGSVASSNADSATKNAGGLVGFSYGTVRASYADVTVTASNAATNVRAGGLVGSIGTIVATGAGSVTASYATGAVSGGTSAASDVGGLVGQLPTSGTPTITASYSTGTATSGANANTGGLAGNNPSGAVITDSYWDTDTSGIADADPSTSAGAGQTTAALQSPTAYGSGIYADWNVDVGGTSANDNPWNFGTNAQYPILQYERNALGIARQRSNDADNDNLIDVTTLAQLNAIRYDLDGNGTPAAGAGAATYAAAFPGLGAGIGCAGSCAGYELLNNLDFDTTGNDDMADAPYDNWTPIGTDGTPYSGTFQGNGHTISNLTVNADATVVTVGLFGTASGAISGVGLPNASVAGARGGSDPIAIGTLAGSLAGGTITSGWATGSVDSSGAGSSDKYVGGLVGHTSGTVRTSYADVTVAAAGSATEARAGGLVGTVFGGHVVASYATGNVTGGTSATSYVGSLVGLLSGTSPSITASYARGTATSGANANVGGLANVDTGTTAAITASYWDVTASSIADTTPADSAGEGRKTYQLRTPTGYTPTTTPTTYHTWDDVDVDNADGDNDLDTGPDDAWDFGTSLHYPVLKYGVLSANTAAQFARQPNLATNSAFSGLSVTGVTLNTPFATGTAAYTASVPEGSTFTSVTVLGTPAHSSARASYSAMIGSAAPVTADADTGTAGYQVTLGGPTTVITFTVTAQDGSETSYTLTITVPEKDYDDDDDGLIDVTTLAQLNAIRYDLDGDGGVGMANRVAYAAAFPIAAAGMGCPITTDDADDNDCTGYELRADLDFNTGLATRTDDAYHNGGAGWTPIGTDTTPYSGTFQGNGHIISNLNVNAGTTVITVGLFGTTTGAISAVGLPNASVIGARDNLAIGTLAGSLGLGGTITSGWATGSVTSSSTSTDVKYVGGLVGYNGGAVRASYAGVTVTAANTATTVHAGGLAGLLFNASVTASYATGAVAGGATSASHTGGLAGSMNNSATTSITASYATGAVSSGALANTGGLVATRPADATVTISYWDTQTSGLSSGIGSGRTTSALQTPTAYGSTGIYSDWNVDADADTSTGDSSGLDDPWYFGTAIQYPILQFDRDAVAIDRQRGSTAEDYDGNDNNLIDVTTLAQLDAIRYDLDGDGAGIAKGSDSAKYAAAFPGLSAGMGCPATCAGYELTADLDFDTTGNDDVADAPYANWTPIGTYTSTFDGSGHTISNLTINAAGSVSYVGLFGQISGDVSGVGLPDASITGAAATINAGVLAGQVSTGGSVTSSWATGSVTSTNTSTGSANKLIGGLVGYAAGPVQASYARVDVTAANTATSVAAGGLVGYLFGGTLTASYATGAVAGGAGGNSQVGGLVGVAQTGASVITASYATGTVTSDANNIGGLVGFLLSGATVVNSYWDTTTSGITGAGGQTTSGLQTPTAYGSGIYSDWNVDVGGTSANDNPWNFGYATQYPALQYDGLDLLKQGRDTILISTAALDVDEGASNTYTVRLGGPPKAASTVTVTIASDNADVTINPAMPTFNAGNWNSPRTVTVSAASDTDLADGTATLTHTATGAGSGFENTATTTLSVAIDDTTTPAITLTRNSAAITTLDVTEEATPNVTYDVALTNAPLANVTVTVTVPSDHTASLRINKAGGTFASSQTLTFTTTNYNTAQMVTIQAPDDGNNDNEPGVTLSHAATDATSTASGYDGISKNLTVNVTDNDIPNLLLSQASLSVEEEDASGESYTVRLSTLPSADVMVTVTATGNLTIDGPDASTAFTASETLTFSTTTGTTAQTINVRAGGDNDLADDTTPTITHNPSSTDTDYNVLSTKTLSVTITDDDEGSLVLSETTRTVTEGDDTGAAYTVKLSHRPSATVTVAISNDAAKTTVTPASLTFNASTWNNPQTVTVKAVADANAVDDTDTITHTASETGGFEAGVTADVTVMVQDTTAPGITLSESELSLDEGVNDTYTVRLAAAPVADTTVAIASGNPAVTVNPASLEFTTTDFATIQTVTVSNTADADTVHNVFEITHTPTIRGVASDATPLPVLLREPGAAESSPVVIIPPTDATPTTHTINATTTLTVIGAPDLPEGITARTVQGVNADLSVTFSSAAGTPTTRSGYTLDGATLVDISATPAPPGGLQICLPIPQGGSGTPQLMHYQSGSWRTVPSRVQNGKVCGTVTDFSPFITGRPATTTAAPPPPPPDEEDDDDDDSTPTGSTPTGGSGGGSGGSGGGSTTPAPRPTPTPAPQPTPTPTPAPTTPASTPAPTPTPTPATVRPTPTPAPTPMPAVTPTALPPTQPPPVAAAIQQPPVLGDITFSNNNPQPGSALMAEFPVTNPGPIIAEYQLTLEIAGEVVQRQTLTIPPGQTQAVQLPIVAPDARAEVTVRVDGQSQIAILTPAMAAPTPPAGGETVVTTPAVEPAGGGAPWLLIGIIAVIALAIVGGGIALLRRRRAG